jgi:hypothetical protein
MLLFRYKLFFPLFIFFSFHQANALRYLHYSGYLMDDTSLYKYFKVTELNYHPQDVVSGTDTIPGKYYEFIEFKNTGTTAIDLTGLVLDSAVYYEFPSGFLIQPGEFYVIATKTRYFYEKYGMAASGNCQNYFDNAGEYILLRNAAGKEIFSFTYDDHIPWPEQADGDGYTLTAREQNPLGDPNDYSYWMASSVPGGTPFLDDNGQTGLNPITTKAGQLVFSIYPNPTHRFLNIQNKSEGSDNKSELKIFSTNGILIFDTFFRTDMMVDLKEISPRSGLYIMLIISEGYIQVEKIIFDPY